MFKKFLVFAVAFALIMPMDAMAGKSGSSGGGSRSSSSGFSGSRSSGSSFSGSRSSGSGFSSKPSAPSMPSHSPSSPRSTPSGFSSKPSTPPATHSTPSTPSTSSSRSSPSGFSSSPTTKSPATTTSKPAQTTLDSKVAKANTVSAPSYKTKEQAVAAFKEKNASTYTSKFTTEPKTRPEYIPPSTNVGGKTVNISYNASFGGYGYYHPSLGTWMAYDMMHDAAMMSMMMNRHGNYTYVDGPGYGGGNVVVTSPGPMSYWAGAILIIFLFAFIIFMIRVLREV